MKKAGNWLERWLNLLTIYSWTLWITQGVHLLEGELSFSTSGRMSLDLYVAFVMQMAAGAGIRHNKTLLNNKSWWRERLLCVQGFTRAWSVYITGTRTLPSRAAESLLSSAALPNLITLQVEVAVLLEGMCSLGLLILMINVLIRSCRTSRL